MSSKAARRQTSVFDGNVHERRSTSPAQSSQFTIGKLDAGIAVLLGDESSHLIEFPSLLLPPGCQPGSIVSISCTRDIPAEKSRSDEFWSLQDEILAEFGQRTPTAPSLRLRNVTQTSVTLEWDKLELATSKLLGLTIWRNGQRVASIPNPVSNTSTKLSGLELDTEFTFHLVLKTSAGTFPSNQLRVRTHKITDTSGISACFGAVSPPAALDDAKRALEAMGAKFSDKIQIDTTHFVCTSPGTGAPAIQYQRALQLSIPTVLPSWVLACQREKRMVQIAAHYLGTAQPAASTSAAPPTVQVAAPERSPKSVSTSGASAEPSSSTTSGTPSASVAQTAEVDGEDPETATSPRLDETTVSRPEEAVEEPRAPPTVDETPTDRPVSPTDNIAVPPEPTSPPAEDAAPPPASEEIDEVQRVVPVVEAAEPDAPETATAEESKSNGEADDDVDDRVAPSSQQKVDIDALEEVAL